jgi:adenylylsulfate kinase
MVAKGKRSLVKAIAWRLIAAVILFLLSLIVLNGDTNKALTVTILYHIVQFGIYFLHERLWARIQWGNTKGCFIQMTGMSGAGKTTLAKLVADKLQLQGYRVEVIDGDEYRSGLCSDLGFSKKDRNINIRRLGFMSKVLARNNVISIISAINPYNNIRKELTLMMPNVKTVYIKCGLNTLKERDTKGLYQKALLPDGHAEKIYNFTGISDPYEEPQNADLVIDTETENIKTSAKKLEKFILKSI